MEYFPPALEVLTEQFARLGVGKKSAQRLSFFVPGGGYPGGHRGPAGVTP